MTVKVTSTAALYDLIASGDLGRLDQSVLNHLRPVTGVTVPRTRRELASTLGIEASTISGAVNRLIKGGAVLVDGEARCLITGRNVEAIRLRDYGDDYVKKPATFGCDGCVGKGNGPVCSSLPSCAGVIFVQK